MKHMTLFAITLLMSASAARATDFAFATPSDDRWHYPFNFTPGVRSTASCFGAIDLGFNDRDGTVIAAWDTSLLISPGQGPAAYNIQSITVTLTNQVNQFVGPEWPIDLTTDEWFTFDINFDGFINADGIPRGAPGDTDGESDDPDPGRPLELFGVGFGPVFTAATWDEFGIFVGGSTAGGAEVPRDPFPFVFRDGASDILHVEDSVRGLHNAGLIPPLCGPPDTACPFTPMTWAIGTPVNYTPGAQSVPFDVVFQIDLSLSGGQVRQYFQEQLDAGRVIVFVTSLREATQMGAQAGFPSFYMKEGLFDPGSKAPALNIVIVPDILGDIDSDGHVDTTDRDIFAAVLAGNDTDPTHIDRSDLDGNGTPDGNDIALFISAFLSGP